MVAVLDCVTAAVTTFAHHVDVDVDTVVGRADVMAAPVVADQTGMFGSAAQVETADGDGLIDMLTRLLIHGPADNLPGHAYWSAPAGVDPSLAAGHRRVVAARTADAAVAVVLWTP